MPFASLRRRALVTTAGVVTAVTLPLSAATAVAPAASAATVPTALAPTAVQLSDAVEAAATREAAVEKAAAAKKAKAVKTRQLLRGKKIIKVAAKYKGRPYRYGASGPRAFDCSGYTSFVVRKALKVSLPRTAAQQARTGKVKRIKKSARQVGDLIFFGRSVHHVAIYAGNGMMWDSPRTGSHVQKRKIHSGVSGYGRVR